MAGIFQSMLMGKQQAEEEQRRAREDRYLAGERAYQSEERDYMRDKRETTDRREAEDRVYEVGTARPLQSRLMSAQVGSAEFNASRQPVLAGREDEQYAHELSRRPIVEGFQDQQARAGIVGQSLQNRGAQLQLGQAQRADELDKLNHGNAMLQAQLVADHQKAQREWAPTAQKIAQLGMQGRWQDVQQALTEAYAQVNDGEDDTGIRVDAQGNFTIVNPYSGQKIRDLGQGEDGVMAALQIAENYMQSPQQFLEVANQRRQMRAEYEAMAAKAQIEHPERYTETLQGPGGEVMQLDRSTGKATPVTDASGGPVRAAIRGSQQPIPAVVATADKYFSMMEKMPGEDDKARWLRAYDAVTTRAGMPIDDAAQKLWAAAYQGALDSPMSMTKTAEQKDAEARAVADAVVSGFMDRFGEGKQPTQRPAQQPTQQAGEVDEDVAFLRQF
jgi:hypothetical protein